MSVSIHIARQMAGSPSGAAILLHKQGTTPDIVREVLRAIRDYGDQVCELAPSFAGATVQDTARNIWQFLKTQVQYKVDPAGKQWILEPRRFLAQGFADCKGFSIFTSAILRCLGHDHVVRFTGYSRRSPVTHVYIVLADGTPVDAVWHTFGAEKAFSHKKDYHMAEISRLAGANASALKEGSIELRLIEEQNRLERDLGIKPGALVLFIEDDFSKRRAIDKNAAGIPLAANSSSPAEDAAVKSALVGVREAAMYFLYLFVRNKEAIAALPPDAAAQRAEAVQTAKYLVQTLGMSEPLFMRLVRVGIMQQTGKSPEQILVGTAVNGVGFLPLAALIPKVVAVATKAVPVIKNVVSNVKSTFGNKANTPAPVPAPSQAPQPNVQLPQMPEQGKQTLARSSSAGLSPSEQQALSKDGNVPLDPAASVAPKKPFPVGLVLGGGGLLAAVVFGPKLFGGKKRRK